jgi:hypothetical protein
MKFLITILIILKTCLGEDSIFSIPLKSGGKIIFSESACILQRTPSSSEVLWYIKPHTPPSNPQIFENKPKRTEASLSYVGRIPSNLLREVNQKSPFFNDEMSIEEYFKYAKTSQLQYKVLPDDVEGSDIQKNKENATKESVPQINPTQHEKPASQINMPSPQKKPELPVFPEKYRLEKRGTQVSQIQLDKVQPLVNTPRGGQPKIGIISKLTQALLPTRPETPRTTQTQSQAKPTPRTIETTPRGYPPEKRYISMVTFALQDNNYHILLTESGAKDIILEINRNFSKWEILKIAYSIENRVAVLGSLHERLSAVAFISFGGIKLDAKEPVILADEVILSKDFTLIRIGSHNYVLDHKRSFNKELLLYQNAYYLRFDLPGDISGDISIKIIINKDSKNKKEINSIKDLLMLTYGLQKNQVERVMDMSFVTYNTKKDIELLKNYLKETS